MGGKSLLDRLVKPSTRAFTREARRAKDYSLFDFLHGYIYARWPYLYIGVGTGEHRLARIARPLVGLYARLFPARKPDAGKRPAVTFADTYHGKVIPLDTARQLVNIHEPIRVEDLEQVIPYTRARSIILQNPDHIVVLDCPCRSARPNPCLPLDVCLIVGEPFASFISEHQPTRSRWITPEEATGILEAENRRGHVSHAFFKDAMLGRFYAICNCCACCCGAMQAHQNGTPMLTASGYRAQVDEERCIACGACVSDCQFGALSLNGGGSQVNLEECMGCGVCVTRCEQEAITLVLDPSKGIPLEIFDLMDKAASA